MPDHGDKKVDYRAVLTEALGSPHNDGWAERTDPNTGTPISADMFKADPEFAADYARNFNERYSQQRN